MEIADIFVINKSDREGADRVEREIRMMQSLAIRSDKWTPPIIKTVASEGKGITDLAATIASYEQYLQQKDLLIKKKISSWRERLIEMLRDGLLERLLAERLPEEKIASLAADIAGHRRDPYSLVEEIVGSFTGKIQHGDNHPIEPTTGSLGTPDTEARRKEKV
jgi:LAO/AO transport system kinase